MVLVSTFPLKMIFLLLNSILLVKIPLMMMHSYMDKVMGTFLLLLVLLLNWEREAKKACQTLKKGIPQST